MGHKSFFFFFGWKRERGARALVSDGLRVWKRDTVQNGGALGAGEEFGEARVELLEGVVHRARACHPI